MYIRVLVCVIVFASSAFCQGYRDDPELYYIGRGEHASLEGARSRAYANMVEQIQVLVSSSLRTSTAETAAGVTSTADMATLTSSSIQLRDVREEIGEALGVYRVVKYVSRSAVASVFAQRRMQILDLLAEAEAEENAAGPVNLRSLMGKYYQAWLLTGLYPDTVSYPFRHGGRAGVATGIPRAMQAVCDGISFSPARRIEDDYTTWKYDVSWHSRPVGHLRYTFNDGLGESEEEVVNGSAQATFLFVDKRARRIAASVEYREMSSHDALVRTADSLMARYAPVLTIAFQLPGEEATGDCVGPTAGNDTAGVKIVGGVAHLSRPFAALPPVLQPLVEKRHDRAFVRGEIDRLVKRGDIIVGKRTDFGSLDGLHALVLDANGINAILTHTNGTYFNAETGDAVLLPAFSGKTIIWIQPQ